MSVQLGLGQTPVDMTALVDNYYLPKDSDQCNKAIKRPNTMTLQALHEIKYNLPYRIPFTLPIPN